MHLALIESKPLSELHLTITPRPGEDLTALVRRVVGILNARQSTVVRQLVFGPVESYQPTLDTMREGLGDPGLPMTWVEGASCAGGPIAGMQIHAIAGAPVETLGCGSRTLGRVWRDSTATHLVLDALGPIGASAGPAQQAGETLTEMAAGLAQAGMDLRHVARTWFFLDHLLGWYGDFNGVRNQFFARGGLSANGLPASTGVGGRNPAGAAVTAVAWAVRSHDSARLVWPVASPRQCPAPSYGSAFSRAVEIQSAGFRQLLVSGTASIAPEGHTAHAGDVRSQIRLSMEVAGAILESRGMSFTNVTRATAYFKVAGDAPAFADWQIQHEWPGLPVVCACCDICRDDLLFEIELDAISR